MSKMKGMIDQVLDEIAVEEGGDTEITVALVRKYWDEVHPTHKIPLPGTVRNNLEQLVKDGRLQSLPNGKSWTFAEPTDAYEDEMPDSPTPAVESVEDKAHTNEYEWEEFAPVAVAPARNYVMRIRLNPEAKTPYVSVRIMAEVVHGWTHVALLVDKNRNAVAVTPCYDGYQLSPDGTSPDKYKTFRMVGATATAVMERLGVTSAETLVYCDYRDLDGLAVFDESHKCVE